MRGIVLHAPGDVRVEERDDPKILYPTDAIIRLSTTCICGSDRWPYRSIEPVAEPTPMGHEYAGVVEQVGSEVKNIRVGDFVVGSFFASDNTCERCQAGYQSGCVHAVAMNTIGTQAQRARVPLADGTLVATPGMPAPDLIPSFLHGATATNRMSHIAVTNALDGRVVEWLEQVSEAQYIGQP